MRILIFVSLFLFFYFRSSLHWVSSSSSAQKRACTPPRGWNSYDSFCWTVSEEEFLQNAEIVARRLLPHGYEYVVVDYLWYRKKVPGAYPDSLGFDVIDEWGRMIPDPDRWPSSRGGKGFTEVAEKVHGMGLKFGIHVMRGISRQAYDANSPILDVTKGSAYKEVGRQWRAKDIGIKERACAWMSHGFMSVDTKSGAGRAFLRSLYEQYAAWGVDFVKNDCVFGDDLDLGEITYVSEVLQQLHRPILYSLSPGTSVTPNMAKDISKLVNLYRITGDDWDTWGDVAAHFDVSRDFSTANMIGAEGLLGKSWPDLDMLPLGWLTDPGSNEGPHRTCNLSLDEQRTQMTLWAMAKSPLMFGGDARKLDETTYNLITNPTVLEINSFSTNNREFPFVTGNKLCSIKTVTVKQYPVESSMETGTLGAGVVGLTSCEDPHANGWNVKSLDEDLEQVCWKDMGRHAPLCLYRRKPLLASDEHILYEQGNYHLYASNGVVLCMDASSSQRPTSKQSRHNLFSPCRWNANQMWKLNNDRALVSNYSGLCAFVNPDEATAIPTGVRSWIATGRRGEIYVAFFNLNQEQIAMSVKISDMTKVLPGRNLNHKSCRCKEVWSGKELEVTGDSISTTVAIHGTALFVLNCK